MVDKITIIETFDGHNPCLKRARRITGTRTPFIHDTGCNQPHAGRYTDATAFLEEKGYWVRQYANHWNRPSVRKDVHFFGGLDARGNFVICQHLPLNFSAWGCAGSYNYDPTAHIQIETCEDGKTDKAYYELAMENVAALFAWLIQQGICKCKVSDIVDHRTAHKQGGANNHGDVWDWASKQGENVKTYMDGFRARVQRYLDRGPVEVVRKYSTAGMPSCRQSTRFNSTAYILQMYLNQLGYPCDIDGLLWNQSVTQLKAFQKSHSMVIDGNCAALTWQVAQTVLNSALIAPVMPVPADIPAVQHYTGTVKTKYGHGINLWKTPNLTGHVCNIPEGSVVEVTSDCITGIVKKTSAPAKFGVYNGYADTKYLVNRVGIK